MSMIMIITRIVYFNVFVGSMSLTIVKLLYISFLICYVLGLFDLFYNNTFVFFIQKMGSFGYAILIALTIGSAAAWQGEIRIWVKYVVCIFNVCASE